MKKFFLLFLAVLAGAGCASQTLAKRVDTAVAVIDATSRCASQHTEKFCLEVEKAAAAGTAAVADSQAAWKRQPDVIVEEGGCRRTRGCYTTGTRVRTGLVLPRGSR